MSSSRNATKNKCGGNGKGKSGQAFILPVSCALDMVGDKWNLLVIRGIMFLDKRYFGDFLISPGNNRFQYTIRPSEEVGRVRYRFTSGLIAINAQDDYTAKE